MWIHRDALAVSEATTAGDTRYFLNGAMFDKEGRAIATDGHVLLRFTSAARYEPDTDVPAEVIVYADDLKALRALLPKHPQRDANYLHIVPSDEHVTVSIDNGHRDIAIRTRKVNATFPLTEAVLKPSGDVTCVVTLGPEVLEMLCRAARHCNVKALRFEMRQAAGQREATAQVIFSGRGDNGTLDGAIMPMRS